MDKTSDFIRKRIQWKARQFNLSPDYTFNFTDLPLDLQAYLDRIASDENAGNPVLYFKSLEGEWTLICDGAVIGFDNENIYSIVFKGIKTILPKIMDDIKARERVNISRPKSELNELVVTAIDGTKYTFYTRTGQDHFALHNILLMLKQII